MIEDHLKIEVKTDDDLNLILKSAETLGFIKTFWVSDKPNWIQLTPKGEMYGFLHEPSGFLFDMKKITVNEFVKLVNN